MRPFTVTIRTEVASFSYSALSQSSADAWFDAAASQGDRVCAITVMPAGAK